MAKVIDINSRRKPASFQVPGRTSNGSIPYTNNHNATFVQQQAVSQFMMSEVEKGSLVSHTQFGQVQAGIASFFECRGVFLGLSVTEKGTEILCVPAEKGSTGTWHIFSHFQFFWACRKKELLGTKSYKLKDYLEVLPKFIKLPQNYTIRVIRKPTRQLWDEFRAKNTIK